MQMQMLHVLSIELSKLKIENKIKHIIPGTLLPIWVNHCEKRNHAKLPHNSHIAYFE